MKRRTFDFRNDAPKRRLGETARKRFFNISRLFGENAVGVMNFLYF